MNSKFYVSYEAARLLKEKGYNEECDTTIDDDGELFDEKYLLNQDLPVWRCSCPTKAEVIDWLESKELVIEATSLINGNKWRFSLYKRGSFYIDSLIDDRLDFPTRLEAEEAAIIKALELLQ